MTAVLGWSLFNLAAYGADQNLAQRLLTAGSAKAGARTALLAMAINIPVVCVFLLIGLLLWIFYQQPELMMIIDPADSGQLVSAPDHDDGGRKVFLTYILHCLPPGVTGLMFAGLFAAGLSSFNSSANCMAAVVVTDFYKPHRPGRSDDHYLLAGRVAMSVCGLALGAFAVLTYVILSLDSEITLLDYVMNVMMFAWAGLVGVFLCCMCTKRGSGPSLIAGLAVGVGLMMFGFAVQGGKVFGDGSFSLAFPWQFVIASTAAFLVSMCGAASAPTTDLPNESEGVQASV